MITALIIMGVVILLLVAAVVILAILWRREYNKRWQETSVNLSVEKEYRAALDERQMQLDEANRALCASNASKDALYAELAVKEEERDMLFEERNALQAKLSDTLCPTANHVWLNGKCVKCGKLK